MLNLTIMLQLFYFWVNNVLLSAKPIPSTTFKLAFYNSVKRLNYSASSVTTLQLLLPLRYVLPAYFSKQLQG